MNDTLFKAYMETLIEEWSAIEVLKYLISIEDLGDEHGDFWDMMREYGGGDEIKA